MGNICFLEESKMTRLHNLAAGLCVIICLGCVLCPGNQFEAIGYWLLITAKILVSLLPHDSKLNIIRLWTKLDILYQLID